MKTKILWKHWYIDDEMPCLYDLNRLIKTVQSTECLPELFQAYDSEGDMFLVLASGDTSPSALTEALDAEND